jgi:branched-chain amino acid transport system permease protein
VLYREAGQFKTSYVADQAIFPIAQDRWFVILLMAFAFLIVPLFAGQYLYTEVLIPVLILSIAAIGLNILTGYCGQLSLGSGGFMAVGTVLALAPRLRRRASEPTVASVPSPTPTDAGEREELPV